MSGRAMCRRLAVVGFTLLVLVSAAIAGTASAQTPTNAPETDNTVTEIVVNADGSARWIVRIRTRLATADDIETYEAFQKRFRENRSGHLESFRSSIENIVAEAAATTGREMTAQNFSAETRVVVVPRRWGIVSYAFTWEGFANTDDRRLAVGDAFESGFYIAENDTLKLSAPSQHTLDTIEPPPDDLANGTATWIGPVEFGSGQPAAVVVPVTSGNWLPVVFIGLAAAVLVAVGLILRNRRQASLPRGKGAKADSPTEVVTDEERIRHLLAENGGKMRQADIVAAVDWSKSKVSRTIADLEDRGVVEKTRLGRENVVALAAAETD